MLWKVVHNVMMTRTIMLSMGLNHGDMCFFYSNNPETTHHILFRCNVNLPLFRRMMMVSRSIMLSTQSAIDLNLIYKSSRWRTMKARMLTICLKEYLTIVWPERNQICFEKKRRDGEVIRKCLMHEILEALKRLSMFPSASSSAWSYILFTSVF